MAQVVWQGQYKVWGELVSAKHRFAQAQGESSTREWELKAPSVQQLIENSEIITNNLRFQGQYFDLETGLHYNRYRYYSRFISKDPIGLLGGLNGYAYAPNPISWVDPLGLAKNKEPVYRKASLREIKRDLGIPRSQDPISQKMVFLTDKFKKPILNDKKQPIKTRELTYQVGGKKIIVQDHSAGHDFGQEDGTGNQPSHHNVRPEGNTRIGSVEGMDDHYYFDCRNKK